MKPDMSRFPNPARLRFERQQEHDPELEMERRVAEAEHQYEEALRNAGAIDQACQQKLQELLAAERELERMKQGHA